LFPPEAAPDNSLLTFFHTRWLMATDLDRTCWRAIQIDHPADWELSVASGFAQPGRCVWSDRAYQRLDVQWKQLTYTPNLSLLLDKFRQKQDSRQTLTTLEPAPADWQGLIQWLAKGCIVHAGTFFKDHGLLVEAMIVWPARRDSDLEQTILESVRPIDLTGPHRPWKAMGMWLDMPSEYDMKSSSSTLGKVSWDFTANSPTVQNISVERIALPGSWLDKPLRDWLTEQIPKNSQIARQDMISFNNHRCERIISRPRKGPFTWLGTSKSARLDVAWLCEKQSRVYRVTMNHRWTGEEPLLPPNVRIHCCWQSPAVVG